VFGFAGFRIGAEAEYMCLPERGSIAHKPSNIGFAQAAAAVDGATTALFFLRDRADIRAGQRVLVIGASGSIGTYAVQLARHFGAHVTGVCSTSNIELVRGLGAHHVIDYTREDFTAGPEPYDIVFDTVGKSSFARCKPVMSARGCYLPTTGLVNYGWTLWTRIRGGKRVLAGMSVEKREALAFVRSLIETGALQIVIDRSYPLDAIVEAHRYVDTGRKRGNVVVTVRADDVATA
jgi:NADPH2:quinone reductase